MIYKLIYRCKPHEFMREINDMIADGWEPLGGISSDGHCLWQAMIKKEPKP